MKKIIINFFIWLFLFAVIFTSVFSYSSFRIFLYTDILLIASAVLMFFGMIWTSFIFTFIYSLILDSIFMNFLGINMTSYLLALLVIFYLCENMNTDNLLIKILIILVACLFRIIIYIMLVFFFYWNVKFYFFSAGIFLQVILTVCLGAVILWMNDLVRSGIAGWQKTR